MAYDFNGSTQYISADSSPLGNRPTAYTMACWVKGAAQDGRYVLSLGNSSNNNPVVGLASGQSSIGQSNSTLRFFGRDNSGAPATGSINLSGGTAFDNTWRHVAGTWDNSTARAYVDGVEVANGGSMGTPQDLNRFSVGALLRASAALYFSGSVAEVALYDATLSAAQIASLAKGFVPPSVQPSNLVTYIALVRNIQDTVGGITLTNNNTATVANHPRVYA